jgi:hypothetical protein
VPLTQLDAIAPIHDEAVRLAIETCADAVIEITRSGGVYAEEAIGARIAYALRMRAAAWYEARTAAQRAAFHQEMERIKGLRFEEVS